MSVPQSKIYICSGVKLNSRYEHTIYWDSVSAQRSWFLGKVVKTITGYTYLRKSWDIQVDAHFSDARKWDYLFFENADGKTWYYFIKDVEYVNENMVKLALELDVMQTYAKDYNLSKCFVEREHVKNDTIGANTVEEGIDFGELVDEDTEESFNVSNDLGVMILATYDPRYATESDHVLNAIALERVFSGLGLYFCPRGQFSVWNTRLNQLDEMGISDGIVAMWMYPEQLVEKFADPQTGEAVHGLYAVTGVRENNDLYHYVDRPSTIQGETVRHNKLFCYPYNFIYATNNHGGSAIYRYEHFGTPSYCGFYMIGGLSPEAGIRVYPLNYNGTQHNYESGLSLTAFPTCAWDQDVYKLWLAQNQNQLNNSALVSIGAIGAGIGSLAMGNVLGGIGGITGGVAGISSLMAQNADKQIQPPQAKGNYSGSVAMVVSELGIFLRRKVIRKEWLDRLQSFFDLYGYKVNQIKTPSLKNRECWTFVKTNGCNIRCQAPDADKVKIESIFDKGITFWCQPEHIGDYSQSNDPI